MLQKSKYFVLWLESCIRLHIRARQALYIFQKKKMQINTEILILINSVFFQLVESVFGHFDLTQTKHRFPSDFLNKINN